LGTIEQVFSYDVLKERKAFYYDSQKEAEFETISGSSVPMGSGGRAAGGTLPPKKAALRMGDVFLKERNSQTNLPETFDPSPHLRESSANSDEADPGMTVTNPPSEQTKGLLCAIQTSDTAESIELLEQQEPQPESTPSPATESTKRNIDTHDWNTEQWAKDENNGKQKLDSWKRQVQQTQSTIRNSTDRVQFGCRSIADAYAESFFLELKNDELPSKITEIIHLVQSVILVLA
jgi:hypothetical protein